MKTIAAVVREPGELSIEEITLDPPQKGEVLVRMLAAGVCHSDLHTYLGELRVMPPLVLGHEGAGIVEEVGPGVTRVVSGDHVMINWLPADGTCRACLRGDQHLCERLAATTFAGKLLDGTTRLHTEDGIDLKHYLTASTMSERMVYMEDAVIPVPADVPAEVVAITGCAVATGVGTVVNSVRAKAGSSAVVIGCGGIGLSMIQGAKLSGCHPIVAIDLVDSRLEFAERLGATHTIDPARQDATDVVRALTGPGADYAFDSVGSEATINQALQLIRPGGTAAIAGLHAAKAEVAIAAGPLVLQAKTLMGAFGGSLKPRQDLPRLIELYQAGLLQTDQMITHRYKLEDVSQAFADMQAGRGAKGVIVFDDEE